MHDVAPGAKLLFTGPASSLEMAEAVRCLADAGANVIVDDLGFFGEPYFEDGPVATAVRAAVTSGVSYHSSAGNEAREHLEISSPLWDRTGALTISPLARAIPSTGSSCRRAGR